ncbi:MAG: metalloprotease PmbA [Ottowia sp.]|nr:metalloprotease PmbA [Ottowia sp.]
MKTVASDCFSYSQAQLKEFSQTTLDHARACGATDAATEFSESTGLSVTVRKGQTETIERNRDKGMGITVFIGQRRGHASTSDFSEQALKATVEAAYNIARFTAEDNCAGLPDPTLLEHHPQDLDLFHRWDIDAPHALSIAQRAEQAAFSVSPLISNSDGASVSTQHAHFIYANSQGFSSGYPTSRHFIACAPIAGTGTHMQRDDWYSSARSPAMMAHPENIGTYAAQRALARLHPRNLSTRKCPVLFEAPLAIGLLGAFVQAVSGGALYRKSSFLLNSLGQAIFPEHISIYEEPHQLGAMGSAPFDDEGVRTQRRDVVHNGIVQGYFLSTYSARKLGMTSTGNAGGSHNLQLKSKLTQSSDDLCAMLKKMGTGLLVTDLMGQGVNYVTGDYSRGASGYWVEHGKIAYPVEGITIAGNLKQMFHQLAAIGNDITTRGTKQTGSILIEEMMIAGH